MKESNKKYPMINQISLRNVQMVESALFEKRFKGDIYYGNTCIGYYNPLYHTDPNKPAIPFIRIEDEYSDKVCIDNYLSMFFTPLDKTDIEYYQTQTEEPNYNYGAEAFFYDLEVLNLLYSFLNNLSQNNDTVNIENVIGFINNNNMNCIVVKEKPENTYEMIKDYLIKSNKYEENYPIWIFNGTDNFNLSTNILRIK